eukprot:7376486-Prymnesium_polylepis.1
MLSGGCTDGARRKAARLVRSKWRSPRCGPSVSDLFGPLETPSSDTAPTSCTPECSPHSSPGASKASPAS